MKYIECENAVPDSLKVLQRSGSVLLVPTETVYGLVCSWKDDAARARIYELKHRSENKPLAAFVASVKDLPPEILPLPDNARHITEAFCPGPVTLVVPDRNGSTFGFRIPDHPFILDLLRAYGGALASTSANLSGKKAALSVPEALESIAGEVDLAVDGGVLKADSLASTVIRIFEDSSWKILREGPVTAEMIEKVCTSGGE